MCELLSQHIHVRCWACIACPPAYARSASPHRMESSLERPHLLQMPDNSHIGIHIPINAVLHARLLASVQFAGGDLAGDALFEAPNHPVSRCPLI